MLTVDDVITPEERERFQEWKKNRSRSYYTMTPYGERMHMAAFMGIVYGWQAVRDILDGEIELFAFYQLYRATRWELEKYFSDQALYQQWGFMNGQPREKDNRRNYLFEGLNSRLGALLGERAGSKE